MLASSLFLSAVPFSSALRQSLLALQTQHESQLASTGSIAHQKSMINLGSEFYARAVVSVATLRARTETQCPRRIPPQRVVGSLALCFVLSVRSVVSPDPTRLFLDVGLNFHVELSVPEAIAWIDLKLPSLERKMDGEQRKSAMIQSKIKIVYEGIAEIMQLQEQKKPQRKIY